MGDPCDRIDVVHALTEVLCVKLREWGGGWLQLRRAE